MEAVVWWRAGDTRTTCHKSPRFFYLNGTILNLSIIEFYNFEILTRYLQEELVTTFMVLEKPSTWILSKILDTPPKVCGVGITESDREQTSTVCSHTTWPWKTPVKLPVYYFSTQMLWRLNWLHFRKGSFFLEIEHKFDWKLGYSRFNPKFF